ncbi:MAG TPA: DEAD/DEAH box helicase family protein [Longimicrobium sp.]|jgi:superfamily II DNA or RNA helicase
MGTLITIEYFDNFRRVLDCPPGDVPDEALSTVRGLDEREELEPAIRAILTDVGVTPHGPAEIVDILTHKTTVNKKPGIAAFILKGRSFPTVRPVHVAHQIYRLEKINDLAFAVFAATGTILDAAKEQFVSTASRVSEYYSIFDALDLARLLISYGFICPRDGRRISAGRCVCGYSPAKRILNVLQEQALRELRSAHVLRQSSGLVILPPGSGKTRIAAEDANSQGAERILYVAHTHEILQVAESEFVAVFGRAHVKQHTGGASLQELARVNLATIQLLREHLGSLHPQSFDYLVVDEFHHAAARSYRDLLRRIQPRFLLGLTATPRRGDRQDIAELCQRNVVVNYELRSGIEMGVLAPYHYYGCFDDVDYTTIRHNGTQYNIRDLERALIIPERDQAVIRKWREIAEGKPTIAFCCTHRHAQRVMESFVSQGIAAETYLSTTSIQQRKRLQRRFERGEVRVLCTVDVLNEGADFPYIDCLLFLRPTESERIFYQQLGRGLRRYPGKSHCTVVDFIGNFKNAYRVVEYQGLLIDAADQTAIGAARSSKELLNLPLGCRVEFDDRVIDLFTRQLNDPRAATRHNIGRILLYQYRKLWNRLGRKPTARDVDRLSLLGSNLYRDVFGSWTKFSALADHHFEAPVAGAKLPS